MLEHIVPFLIASVLLTVSPGPDIIFVLVQSMTRGKKSGIVTTAGLVSGILIHTSLVAFGVSAIIKGSDTLFLLIKILGALYLFYLAFKVWRSTAEISLTSKERPVRKDRSLFKQGFIMNILNPKVTIFFLAFFPGFLWDPNGNTVHQFFILGLLFMLQAFLVFGLVAILAGKISDYFRNHRTFGVVLKWVQVIVLTGIGVFILV